MSGIQHQSLGGGRWWQLSLVEQLGHVGSEISRALAWRSRNADVSQRAVFRALELLDLTLDDPRLRASPARLREVARAREVVVDYFAGANTYSSTGASLKGYFDRFAMAARRSDAGPGHGSPNE